MKSTPMQSRPAWTLWSALIKDIRKGKFSAARANWFVSDPQKRANDSGSDTEIEYGDLECFDSITKAKRS